MPSKTLKKPTETEIQASIIELLHTMGLLAWRCQAIPVPIRRGNQIVGLRKANGFTVGIPDILLVIKGRLIGIEVKDHKGKLSPEQEVWRDRILKAGGLWMLARGVEEVHAFLKENRLI